MKKKLSIFLTLALATFVATGCEALDEFFGVNEQPQTEQKEESKENEGTKDENTGDENQPTNPGDTDTPTTPDQPGDPETPTNPDTPQQQNYTVTFDPNSGSGTMAPQTTSGSTFVVPNCAFFRDGYLFSTWAYESKNGYEYDPGETITGIDKNITLYALWDENTTPTPGTDPVDPTNYYSGISDSLRGAQLKTALHNLINITTAGWSYAGLWDAYKTTDVRLDGEHYWDIYSDSTMYTLNDKRINASYKKEGDSINREHIIPQGSFNEAAPMKSDIHHVLPSDGYVNNRRGSYPHGNVTGNTTYTSNDGCKLGTGTGNTTVFEPMPQYKGDIARIYFYFVTCYQNKLSSNSFSAFDKTTYPSIKTVFLDLYLQWAIDDPVSQKEIDRNNAAYEGQKNRNPFIDHPQYACRIWGSSNNACGGNS